MELIKKTSQQCPQCKVYVFKNTGCDHINCVCGKEFCYRCGGDFTSYVHDYQECQKHEFKDVTITAVNWEFSLVETLYQKISTMWNKHRLWLEEQKTTEYYKHFIDTVKLHDKFGQFTSDDYKLLHNYLKVILRSRRLLKSSYIYAFMFFGFDKVKLTKTNKNSKEISAIETYGLLFDEHLSRLENYVGQLLNNLDLLLNTKHKDKAVMLEMTNKNDLITKEQKNVVSFINGVMMKEISYK